MNSFPFALSWQLQASLAFGYVGYWIAYAGQRTSHQSADVFFGTLFFGLISALLFGLSSHLNRPIIATAAASLTTLFAAVVWRARLGDLALRILRWLNLSWANDDPSALATLTKNSLYGITQIAVELTDGRWFICDDLRRFEKTPFKAFTVGPEGDVLMYVTCIDLADGTSKPQTNVANPIYGDRITYVPASSIRSITLRHLPSRALPAAAG